MKPPNHIPSKFLFIVLVLATIVTVDRVSGQEAYRYFDTDMTSWDVEEWRMMTDSERWMFIHGMALASWVYGQTTLEVINDPAEIERRLRRLETILERPVSATWRLLENYYDAGGEMPLWQSPYYIESQGDRN